MEILAHDEFLRSGVAVFEKDFDTRVVLDGACVIEAYDALLPLENTSGALVFFLFASRWLCK